MKLLIFTILAAAAIFLTGCFRGEPSGKPPIHINPNMDDQERYNSQARSEYFPDGATMRTPPAGTIPRGWLHEDQVYYTGKIDTTPVEKLPVPITAQLLSRGQERFNIFCAPCHSRIGDGRGMTVERGLPPPPSFHEERIVKMADGHYFDVISNGIRNMPAYRYQIPVSDRWAIVAYLRALQRSQNARLEDIPAELRNTVK
ncbi:MAG: c-type cytochrome [Candidatus Zixiibacteriota bacterium]